MTRKTKFGDIEVGQRFTLGPASYLKVNARDMGQPCGHCKKHYYNVIRLDKLHGFNHFCDGDIIIVTAPVIQISDDLTLIVEEPGKYRLITVASKAGAEAFDGGGFIDIADSEIPALVRALIATQPCRACVISDAETGQSLLHSRDCPEYMPF